MYRLILSRSARTDLVEIESWTIRHFGIDAADSYRALFEHAFETIEQDPYCRHSRPARGRDDALREYHIKWSRAAAGGKVKNPRHFVLYYIVEDEKRVLIGRVVHDVREKERRKRYGVVS